MQPPNTFLINEIMTRNSYINYDKKQLYKYTGAKKRDKNFSQNFSIRKRFNLFNNIWIINSFIIKKIIGNKIPHPSISTFWVRWNPNYFIHYNNHDITYENMAYSIEDRIKSMQAINIKKGELVGLYFNNSFLQAKALFLFLTAAWLNL